MLPSPTWPNGTGRHSGDAFFMAASPCVMKVGILLTDTEMSCLIDGPSRFWDSEWFSRKLQKPGLVGAGAARAGRRPFQQHVPLVPLAERIGSARDVLQDQVDALAGHQ